MKGVKVVNWILTGETGDDWLETKNQTRTDAFPG